MLEGKAPEYNAAPLNEIHIEQTDGPAAGPLNTEVVDRREINAIHAVGVLAGRPAANGNVVAKAGLGEDSGEALNSLADVQGGAGHALHFGPVDILDG